MIKPIFVFLSLLALSGCVHLPQELSNPLKKDKKPKERLSEWHQASFDFCFIRDTELDDFQLPYTLDLWDRIREGFVLHHVEHPRVQKQISWYDSRAHYIYQMSERAGPYLFHIVEELDRRGMPMEFALLPIVESSFDPFAYSHGRAAGMWQVIPGTARALGLKQNWWYDGRRDIVASTDAALNYLEQLHRRFDNDWLLALAAYNGGQGNVARAIRKNRQRGRPTDYWSLDLPTETEMYVPKLLAIRELVNTPSQYQVNLASIPNEPFFELVDVGSQISLARAAELAGITITEFQALNPGFNRWATDPEGPHQLLVPSPRATYFRDQLGQLSKHDRMVWDIYTVRRGDNLSAIAGRFSTSVNVLQQLNGLANHSIREGATLLVPVVPQGQILATVPAEHLQRVTVKAASKLNGNITYKVQKGDSLWSIARKFKLDRKQLQDWNKLKEGDQIFAGQSLIVWNDARTSASSGSAANTVKKVAYKVRQGDSLAGIADKFNLKVKDILAWNDVNPKSYIRPGDSLTLFVDITRAQY